MKENTNTSGSLQSRTKLTPNLATFLQDGEEKCSGSEKTTSLKNVRNVLCARNLYRHQQFICSLYQDRVALPAFSELTSRGSGQTR